MIERLSKPAKALIYGRFQRLMHESKVPIGLSTLGDMVDQAAHKNALRQVREWGDSYCITAGHYGLDKRANTKKRECVYCWQELKKLSKEG